MLENDKDKLIAELQSEVSQLKTILNKIPGNVYWIDKNGHFLGGNTNVAKILKLASPADIPGTLLIDKVPVDIVHAVQRNDLEVIENQVEISIEESGVDLDGKPAIYVTQKAPFYDDEGKLAGLIGVSMNITKQKKAEEELRIAKRKAEAASYAKSQFLATISHELRTPLTSIIGFASFLRQEDLSLEERRNYIQYLVESGDYLLALINKILDYSKLEAEKAELKLAPVNLKKTIADIEVMLSGLTIVKKLPLYLEYDSNIPELITTDEHLLRQVLVNLLGNAIKFTQVGHITIKVSCIEKTVDAVELEIAIQDTGIGIPASKIKYIFDEFYQTEDIYLRDISASGTGLGLAIVKKLADLLGMRIHVLSKLNQGSTFFLTARFPIAQSLVNNVNQAKKSQESSAEQLVGHRVLLVEDDQLVQFIHNKMLTNLGCRVDIAEHGKKALDMFKNNYDAIFIDIGLPQFNGFDVIKEMRARELPGCRVPIIALTGFSTNEEKNRCISMGADAVMVKPVSQAFLLEMLNKYTMPLIAK